MSDHGHLFAEVKNRILAGVSKKELFDSIKGMTASPEVDSATAGKLRGYAAKLWNQAEAEERTWTTVSTNDRIDAAFEFLQSKGIFAAQNFTCCSSCGHAEAAGALDEMHGRGYVFYHQQDTERGIDGQGLMLAYGSSDGEDSSIVAIGREICGGLEQFGIPYEWDGSPSVRIQIQPFEWRKRRSTKAPPIPIGERGRVIARAAQKEEEPEASSIVLRHPDGREWSATIGYRQLVIRIVDTDGDAHVRVVDASNPAAELESRVADLRADGFA